MEDVVSSIDSSMEDLAPKQSKTQKQTIFQKMEEMSPEDKKLINDNVLASLKNNWYKKSQLNRKNEELKFDTKTGIPDYDNTLDEKTEVHAWDETLNKKQYYEKYTIIKL